MPPNDCSNLNGILAAVMLEHGVSQQTLPNETRFRRLMTVMKDYGTAKMDGDRIIGYLKRLDEAMKHFNVSLPDLLSEASDRSHIDVDRSTYCHQCRPYSRQGGLCRSNRTADRSETIDNKSRSVLSLYHPLLGSSSCNMG
jgi:hypothetical protein